MVFRLSEPSKYLTNKKRIQQDAKPTKIGVALREINSV